MRFMHVNNAIMRLLLHQSRTYILGLKRSVDPPADCPSPVPLLGWTPPTALPAPGQSPLTGRL